MPTRAVVLLVLLPAIVSAQPRVEEQVLGPLLSDFNGYVVAPRGVRVATLAAKGEGGVVIVDGVEGPVLDDFLDPRFVEVSLSPEQNDSKVLDELRHELNSRRAAMVVFSADGARYAYACRIREEFVVIADGKEIWRGPVGPGALCGLRFSPDGTRLSFIRKPDTGREGDGFRLVMDGQASELSYLQPLPVFSPDGAHYAYVATNAVDRETHTLMIDGKPAPYQGVRPKFDGKGRVISIRVDPETSKQTLQLDGQALFTAHQVTGIYPDPTGERFAVVGDMGSQRQEIFINGEPAASAAVIEEFLWSPDGAHYAAKCQSPNHTRYVIYDGANGPELGNVTDIAFAPDSSKLVYMGYVNGQHHVVLNNADMMEGAPMISVKPFFYAPDCKVAWVQGKNLHDTALVMGDQMLSGLRQITAPTFSPDGMRCAFSHGGNNAWTAVIDEMEDPDILPAPFAAASSTGAAPAVHFLFSPDGKHLTYLASSRQNPRAMGVMVDGTLIPTKSMRISRPHFTPDSRHLIWIENERPYDNIYVDGEVAARLDIVPGSGWDSNPATWQMGADGVFTIMGPSGSDLKRFRITPSESTSIETMIAKAKGR